MAERKRKGLLKRRKKKDEADFSCRGFSLARAREDKIRRRCLPSPRGAERKERRTAYNLTSEATGTRARLQCVQTPGGFVNESSAEEEGKNDAPFFSSSSLFISL